MTISVVITTIILALLPIFELRGAIPYAVLNGMPLPLAAVTAFAANALVAPLVLIFLETFHRIFYRWRWYAKLFDRVVARTRQKIHAGIEKYGYWGILLFVAIPLPFTGAWTGTLGAWLFGLGKRKTILAATCGVAIAALIVSLVMGLGISALSLFLKAPQ
ncbi:MAG: ligand-binding protein SH3 [Spirochaetes bacterium GWD1_61_31]|nr:MAG: ligand-binding protein SH3 [Spirochaetes bacterium GWB1_60_80]OHD32451.1 MAG: ligand-binding protein SH3 [Spirochaetes bacterium GWC1_61_12]OHD36130.1 MAG: ligand-binding protein SH3 [Spirochaetes bacterium GWD1_61_31]OHD45016.1 MAG: ligand-binding protein SH3 [Spirochaetes bacterium GWE1_60_18]OHD60127.1 MAG: ligand-binding protein SH3 [Spirochaetes bacterium GWF1_60_12]HAP43697.1 ligand-binding protein SH3 [Spirochaetaceae bacterium]